MQGLGLAETSIPKPEIKPLCPWAKACHSLGRQRLGLVLDFYSGADSLPWDISRDDISFPWCFSSGASYRIILELVQESLRRPSTGQANSRQLLHGKHRQFKVHAHLKIQTIVKGTSAMPHTSLGFRVATIHVDGRCMGGLK